MTYKLTIILFIIQSYHIPIIARWKRDTIVCSIPITAYFQSCNHSTISIKNIKGHIFILRYASWFPYILIKIIIWCEVIRNANINIFKILGCRCITTITIGYSNRIVARFIDNKRITTSIGYAI